MIHCSGCGRLIGVGSFVGPETGGRPLSPRDPEQIERIVRLALDRLVEAGLLRLEDGRIEIVGLDPGRHTPDSGKPN